MEEFSFERIHLGMVVRVEVVHVGRVDQVEALDVLRRLLHVRLGLLLDLDERLLHLHGVETIQRVDDADACFGEVVQARDVAEAIDAPCLVPVPELVEVGVDVPQVAELADGRVVHVIPPRQDVAPPPDGLPLVGRPELPGVRDVLQLLVVASLAALHAELHHDPPALHQLNGALERVKDRRIAPRRRLGHLPPSGDALRQGRLAQLVDVQEHHVRHQHLGFDEGELRSVLDLSIRRDHCLQIGPFVLLRGGLEAEGAVVDRLGVLRDDLPLVELGATRQVLVVPKDHFALCKATDITADATSDHLKEQALRLWDEAVLLERHGGGRLGRRGTALPQATSHVFLAEDRVKVANGVEATHVLWEQAHVRLEHRDGRVPRVEVPSHVLDHLCRNLGLRLRHADAIQQRLADGWTQQRLTDVVLLGQQVNDGLGEARLLLLLQRRPDDREQEHPQVVRHVRVGLHLFDQARYEGLRPPSALLLEEAEMLLEQGVG